MTNAPSEPLEQAAIVDVHPRECAGTSVCLDCGREKRVHICHGEQWKCSDCCDDRVAGEDNCQRMIGRERAGTVLINRRHIPVGWGEPRQWPVEREITDIGRADHGDAVMTNTQPGEPGWLGNPYRLKSAGGDYSREESVERFREVFYRLVNENPEFRERVLELRGQILMGWCVPKLCHGDVVLEWLDRHSD